ncbi:MAG: ribosomal protein S18-alanine N-acetyltransferase [Pseudomonadota bacterium]
MTPQQLAALHKLSFTQSRPWTAQEFATLLATPGVFQLARDNGFALGRVAAGEAELLTIAVSPETRRCGIGLGLIAQFEEEARARGAHEAVLEVAADNNAAQALYARAGYRERGRRRGYYLRHEGPPQDAVILGRTFS